ncbi:MAG: DUF3341 domain-containing protein [Alphaproteobacteria bacterium]|nr:DUF3341 domain-containing protein [Alphaproteobacteria bacterium]
MTVLAEFSTAQAATDAVAAASRAGHPARDVLSPVPLEGTAEHLAPYAKGKIGWVMFVAGAVGGLAGWFMQWYSAVVDYPIISGGRPMNSWPAFLLVPYEAAILSMGVVGLLGWMWMCGLPKLFHPLFAAPIVERAVQDKWLLVFESADAHWARAHLGADAVHEVRE